MNTAQIVQWMHQSLLRALSRLASHAQTEVPSLDTWRWVACWCLTYGLHLRCCICSALFLEHILYLPLLLLLWAVCIAAAAAVGGAECAESPGAEPGIWQDGDTTARDPSYDLIYLYEGSLL